MSSEIVPFVDGSDSSSADEPHDDPVKGKAAVVQHLTDSDAILRRPLGAIEEDVRPFDFLGLYSIEKLYPWIKFWDEADLIGGNHDMRHFLPTKKGPKCITKLNPTLEYVKPGLLERMKEPSVLQLFPLDASLFPFEKFKTLTCLEISSLSNLIAFPENTISEMTHLQILNLSHLPIKQLPNDFFSKLVHLGSLTLKDCPNIHSLPKLPPLTELKYLELSHLLIETLPEEFFHHGLKQLHRVILRGCSKLTSLPSIQPLGIILGNILELDLSHCTALHKLQGFDLQCFGKLDLSYTALHFTSTVYNALSITALFLRDAKVINFQGFSHYQPLGLKVLDVSGAQYVKGLDLLKDSEELEALDLSRTEIESIDFISGLENLRYLILKDCTKLQKLPAMEKLTQLEVLDVSGCEILGDLPEDISSLKKLKELNLSGCSGLKELSPSVFEQMCCLEKLYLSKTNININHHHHLPSSVNLGNLPTLSTSVKKVATCLQTVDTLDHAAAPESQSRIQNLHPRRLSKPNDFYIVSTCLMNSGFDRFKQHLDVIVDLISRFQENFKPVSSLDTIPIGPNLTPWEKQRIHEEEEEEEEEEDTKAKTEAESCPIAIGSHETVKMQCRRMVGDLKYIRHNIGLLESCPNCTRAEELLDQLINARNEDPSDLSQFYFQLNSTNFNQVLRMVMVAKLKLLVPPLDLEKKKNKERKRKQSDVTDLYRVREDLSSSYESLTNTQKNCLLFFTLFPDHGFIKESTLIHLWYGEGLIGPQHVVDISNPPPNPNQNLNLELAACSDPNPEITSASTESKAGTTTNREVSSTAHTIEKIGRKVLMDLDKKFFIGGRRRGYKRREWGLLMPKYTFVRTRAMADSFFNVDHKTRMLTPHLTGSQRACLLISQDDMPSSSELWAHHIKSSSNKIECFKTIRTLVNVNVLFVDIRVEWFSKMTNLSALHLGICYKHEPDSIEVVDLQFLEELKNMKQLRLLNLEGFLTIKKLPDSVCKATNLRILNLRECGYLEELPAGIGSLNNLTHLDLTDCRILSMLPKGISLLSKLEVLKGFVIYYQIGGRQHPNACTLRELFKLEKLRKLNLVVHTEGFPFPDSNDLHVFNGMKNLCSLQITWLTNYNNLDHQQQDADGQKALRHYSSRWQALKCWKHPACQNETGELLKSNLTKLDLLCFPFETAPNWLHPSGLQKLEKLYIRGGKLKTLLARDTNQNTWSVKTLVLNHLHNMYMDWEKFRCNFPHLKYLDAFESKHLSSFPFNDRTSQIWEDTTPS